MSEEKTREFKRSPKAFLESHVLDVQPQFMGDVGVFYFEVVEKGADVYWLERVIQQDADKYIRAHWLPWTPQEATSLILDHTKAEFFFTFQLSGCRAVVGPGVEPYVMHIAATGSSSSLWQDAAATRPWRESAEQNVVRKNGWKDPAWRWSQEVYRDGIDGYAASTIVGKWENAGWEFYTQKFRHHGKRRGEEKYTNYGLGQRYSSVPQAGSAGATADAPGGGAAPARVLPAARGAPAPGIGTAGHRAGGGGPVGGAAPAGGGGVPNAAPKPSRGCVIS